MHLSARINVARPVSFRAQVMDHILEANRTTDIHLEDVAHQVIVAGFNSSAVVAFFCLYCCRFSGRVVNSLEAEKSPIVGKFTCGQQYLFIVT